ncbi:MAG: TonB C-terminal domain-containing protein [Deltaproteobacteria bacterium]|jgi:outer membrane biosynthesis protein TonB|nr:TonB C-terminal domain-containing protein [Deltaproteobacteria bacterium]
MPKSPSSTTSPDRETRGFNYYETGSDRGRAGLVAYGATFSLLIHVFLCWLVIWAPSLFSKPSPPPFDMITIQLVGALEPPAPAAPKAPVNPTLNVPDVVRIPTAEPVIPQPTPATEIKIPEIPIEVIPIGKTPPTPPPPVVKVNEPPPKVTPPAKPPEPAPKPKPKPKPKAPSDEDVLNQRLAELQRKRELESEDRTVNQAIANIAATRGRGDGTSSQNTQASSSGQTVDADRQRYYQEILAIVRSNWVPPASAVASNTTSTFVIVIDPTGRITGKNMLASSGNSEFDVSVEQAINRSKFPPLPSVFGGKPDNPALKFNLNYLSRQG